MSQIHPATVEFIFWVAAAMTINAVVTGYAVMIRKMFRERGM